MPNSDQKSKPEPLNGPEKDKKLSTLSLSFLNRGFENISANKVFICTVLCLMRNAIGNSCHKKITNYFVNSPKGLGFANTNF